MRARSDDFTRSLLSLALVLPIFAAPQNASAQQATATLEEINVEGSGNGVRGAGSSQPSSGGQPPPTGVIGQPPPPYAGGQVGSGTRVGILGNRGVFDTPFSTTGYTEKVIEDQQSRTVADVLANDPSVRTSYPRGTGDDRSLIRGFPVYDQDIGFDGIYGFGSEGAFVIEGISRVEVLKGPTALLNGITTFGAVGGSINLIPKRAYDEPLTRFTTSFISRGQAVEHLDVGRRFGANNEFGVRLNAVYTGGGLPQDRASSEIKSATLGLDYRGDRFRWSFDASYLDTSQNGTQIVSASVLPGIRVPRAPDGRINFQQSWQFLDLTNAFGLVRAEYDIADNWTAFGAVGAAHANYKSLYTVNQIGSFGGDFTSTPGTFKFDTDAVVGEVGVRGRFNLLGIQHSLVITGSGRETTRYQRFAFADSSFASNIYEPVLVPRPVFQGFSYNNPPLYSKNRPLSFGVADTMSFFDDRILLTAGVRQQNVQQTVYDATSGLATSSYDKSATSPAAGIVVKPWENISVYANYIQGLIIPDQAPVGSVNAGAVFPPLVSEQEEVGVKVNFGQIAATLALFQITQPSATLNPTTLVYAINSEQRNRGLELTVFGQIDKTLRLLGGVSFIDARYTRTVNDVGRGNFATGVPDTQLNIGAEWDTPVPGLTLTGRVIYTSSVFVDVANLQSVPGWARLDAGFRYRYEAFGRPCVFRFSVENLLGERYWVSDETGGLRLASPQLFLLSNTIDF